MLVAYNIDVIRNMCVACMSVYLCVDRLCHFARNTNVFVVMGSELAWAETRQLSYVRSV